jgi:hypothetical protein
VDLGVAGELSTDAADSVFVTVQNLGGDKLDFWTRRTLFHACGIATTAAHCRTRVTIANRAPRGLPDYVVQTDKPSYALYRGYLEFYVPAGASVTGAALNGEEATVFRETEDGRTSLGMHFHLPRAEDLNAEVSYELPLDGSYSLDLTPQPLAHDAQVRVRLDPPDDWAVAGAQPGSTFDYTGRFDTRLRVTAEPGRETGLSALWKALSRFWREPVF